MRKLLYKTFAKLFYYPDSEITELLKKGVVSEFFGEVLTTNAELDSFNEYLRGFENAESLLEDMQVEYTRLFITAFPEVPAPIFRSYYVEKELFGESTGKIIDFYEKHDFHLSKELNEPPDHIAVELEFVFRMIEEGIPENEQVYFIKENILSWTDKFAGRIRESAKTPFYPFLINAIINYLNDDVNEIEKNNAGVEK